MIETIFNLASWNILDEPSALKPGLPLRIEFENFVDYFKKYSNDIAICTTIKQSL